MENNRKIKFRVWNHDRGEMSHNSGEVFSILSNLEHVSGKFWAQGPCSLMQFTGLKDKRGKEVFEGDIVKFNRWRYPLDSPNVEDYLCSAPKKIVWGPDYGQYPTAGFCAISTEPADLEDGHQLNHMDQRNMTVIGNIYEGIE